MYNLINIHIEAILNSIRQRHVFDYDHLVQNLGQAGTAQYQAKYRSYWGMNRAITNANYFAAYFRALEAAHAARPDLQDLIDLLYPIPIHANGRTSLQFSFISKLLHMVDGQLPVYDSLVASFYFFPEQDSGQEIAQRIIKLTENYTFLTDEYARILQHGLLTQSIHRFRHKFNPQHFTDERIIDSLIWSYVKLLRKRDGQIVYV